MNVNTALELPMQIERTAEEVRSLFWKRVAILGHDECWEWRGCKTDSGYAQIWINKRGYYVHRIAWLLTHGDIPEGVFVLHRCDNRICVNLNHLFLGSHQDNMDDKVSKGRQHHPRGELHGAAKLTDETVLRIRGMYPLYNQYQLSEMFGVSQAHISHIIRREVWRHV